MTLVKSNKRKKLFPWSRSGLQNFLSSDDFFNDDFFFNDSFIPAMNVKENEEHFEIEFAAPGFSKKEFKISIDDNVLNVGAEKRSEKEENDDDYSRKEFSFNSFNRSLKLPNSVKSDSEIKAVYKNGILKLNLPKSEETQTEIKNFIDVE